MTDQPVKPAPQTLTEALIRGELMEPDCPSRKILRNMTSQWGLLVLIALSEDGTLRFSALRRRIGGVSERMLAETLKRLESHGLVLRVAYPVVPPQTEYSLTVLGEDAARHVAALADWVEVNLPQMIGD